MKKAARKFKILYWVRDFSEQTGYKKGQEIPEFEVCEVMMNIFNLSPDKLGPDEYGEKHTNGLNVMLRHGDDANFLCIDDRGFGQR